MADAVPGLVSVIVPVYNRPEIVKATIESILAQTYTHIEIILINDGSTDNTLSVLQAYARRDDRIVVIDQPNSGHPAARNNGIAVARGEFIAFLDSDDTWAPEKLAEQIPLFTGNVGLVFCGVNDVTADGEIVRTEIPQPFLRGNIHRHLLRSNRMTGGSVVLSRKVIDTVGTFDPSYRSGENYDMWLRVSKEFDADFVPRALMNYMLHAGNMSADRTRAAEGAMMILKKYLPTLPDDPELREIYRESYAYFYFNLGTEAFARQEYAEARRLFRKAREYIPGYSNSSYRIARSYLGKTINTLLANLKRDKSDQIRQGGV